MVMVGKEIKDLLVIKIKPRDDNMIDQYSRIFMVKILLVSSMVCGLNWYTDKFNCILPGKYGSISKFVYNQDNKVLCLVWIK